MDYRILFPGRFLQSADLTKDFTLTIKSIRSEDIEERSKAIISFEDARKSWVLNRTNAEALKLMWGPETDNWLGKRVTLYSATMKDPFGDGEITAIRVRGSPDLERPMSAVVQRGRKTIKVSVAPTGQRQAQTRARAQPAAKTTPAPASAPQAPTTSGRGKHALVDVASDETEEAALAREAAELDARMAEEDRAASVTE